MNTQTIGKLSMLQDALNEYITPNWKENRTELDFMIASHQEMAELIDTTFMDGDTKHELGWKWWKGKAGQRTMDSVDWTSLHSGVVDNIKIELTDLFFFTLAQKILGDNTDEDEIITLNANDWVNFMSISANNLLQRPGAALGLVIALADKLDFNIMAYYISKLTLNHIRQLSGYKDGSYKKVVDGKEDNELLHDTIVGLTNEDMENDFDNIANGIMTKVYDIFTVNETDRMTMTKWDALIK